MTTQLTWCEECGEDMRVNGGDFCPNCNIELCYSCLKEHSKYCNDQEEIDE